MSKKTTEKLREYAPVKAARASRTAQACVKIPLCDIQSGMDTLKELVKQATIDNMTLSKMRGSLRLY